MKHIGINTIFLLSSLLTFAQTDQQLDFASYFGGENIEESNDIVMANNGNIYIYSWIYVFKY